MDSETLQRLLIDRRLGELPPDASALLEAYLALTPESPDLAEEIEDTIATAQQALKSADVSTGDTLPKLDLQAAAARRKATAALSDESPLTLRPRQDARTWTRGLAVAAAIMIGFFLGSWHGADVGPPNRSPVEMVEVPDSQLPEKPSGFWSISRLRAIQAKEQRTPPKQPQIHWSNPIRKPQIGASS